MSGGYQGAPRAGGPLCFREKSGAPCGGGPLCFRGGKWRGPPVFSREKMEGAPCVEEGTPPVLGGWGGALSEGRPRRRGLCSIGGRDCLNRLKT